MRGTGEAYTKTEHDGLRIIIAQRPQPVEFFLTCRIPERKLHVNIIHENVVHVVLKHGWFVDGLFGYVSLFPSAVCTS